MASGAPRIATAAALALAGACALVALVGAGPARSLAAFAGVLAVTTVAGALALRSPVLLGLGCVLLLGAYLLGRLGAPMAVSAPLFAAGLVALVDLAAQRLEGRPAGGPVGNRAMVHRVGRSAGLAFVVTTAVTAATAVAVPTGHLVQAAGLGAAAGLVALLLVVVDRLAGARQRAE